MSDNVGYNAQGSEGTLPSCIHYVHIQLHANINIRADCAECNIFNYGITSEVCLSITIYWLFCYLLLIYLASVD